MTSASGSAIDAVTNIVSDPLSIGLILVGALLLGASFTLVGYLAFGAVMDTILPDFSSRGPPRQAE